MDGNDPRIEAALASYPVSPLPPGFTRRVMVEVGKQEFRFRLDFLDFALPAFFGLFCFISLLAVAWLLSILDPLWFVRLQLAVRSFQLSPYYLPYWPAILFGIFGVAGIGLGILIGAFALAPQRPEVRGNA